jgi:hypothetical protein
VADETAGRVLRIAFVILVWMIAWVAPTQAQEAIRNGEPFTVNVTSVRSVAPEEHVGFSKSWEVYRVAADGPKMSYILYCTKAAPHVGQSYTALDEYVSADFSWLHLSPVDRKTLESQSEKKKKGRLYRVIIIQNMLPEPHPDSACDIYSETVTKP